MSAVCVSLRHKRSTTAGFFNLTRLSLYGLWQFVKYEVLDEQAAKNRGLDP